MLTIRFNPADGWHDAKIEPYSTLPIDPASMVLHYALEIFEGMKAYHLPDGGATLFRPEQNARRFNNSAERLAMEMIPEELFVKSVEALVIKEKKWIPVTEGSALYLRPFMLGSEIALGTKPSSEFVFCIVASPVSAYFKSAAAPVTLWVSEKFSRAAPGGTGAAKCGGNYAASLIAQKEALSRGCEQVVFLDAVERKWVEELGGMNIFFVFNDGSLQTPPLNGSILPGITRDSLITLARQQGLIVREEPYSIEQWKQDAESGYLTEAFACGTAAVVTPIGEVRQTSGRFVIGDGNSGSVTLQMKKLLTDIQFGKSEDKNNWLKRLF
jgi:branched-chain amino acid aminotransferase